MWLATAPRQIGVAEALEVAGRGQVAIASVAQRQRPVGDLANEPLHEPIAALVRRAIADLLDEELTLDEPAQVGLDPLLGASRR